MIAASTKLCHAGFGKTQELGTSFKSCQQRHVRDFKCLTLSIRRAKTAKALCNPDRCSEAPMCCDWHARGRMLQSGLPSSVAPCLVSYPHLKKAWGINGVW